MITKIPTLTEERKECTQGLTKMAGTTTVMMLMLSTASFKRPTITYLQNLLEPI